MVKLYKKMYVIFIKVYNTTYNFLNSLTYNEFVFKNNNFNKSYQLNGANYKLLHLNFNCAYVIFEQTNSSDEVYLVLEIFKKIIQRWKIFVKN